LERVQIAAVVEDGAVVVRESAGCTHVGESAAVDRKLNNRAIVDAAAVELEAERMVELDVERAAAVNRHYRSRDRLFRADVTIHDGPHMIGDISLADSIPFEIWTCSEHSCGIGWISGFCPDGGVSFHSVGRGGSGDLVYIDALD